MRLIIVIILFQFSTISAQEIQKNIFGFATSNTFTYCNVSDTSFTNKVKEINPQILRFPGGAVGNFYHYGKNGYGFDFKEITKYDGGKFVERSKALVRANIKKGHTHDYIDDFIQLVKLTDSKVVLVANMFVRNDDIIKMISNIQSQDIEIIGVELGSELSNRTFYQKGYKIENYISDAKNCSNKIKENFPNLRTAIIAAPLHSNPTHRHSVWNKKLSKMDFYDDIIIHSYAKVVKGIKEFGQMLTVEEEGETPSEAFDIYKNRALEFLTTDFSDEIKEYNKIFNKPIWITEWNLQISRTTGNTMLQSLFVAQYFLEIMSNVDLKNVTLTTYHNLGGRDYGGSIFRNNQEVVEMQSTYYPITFLGKIFENDIVRIEKKVKDEIFIYKCFDKSETHLLTIIINWSPEKYNEIINQNRLVKQFFSKQLFDKAGVNGKLSASNSKSKNKILSLQPFSISLIKHLDE